MGQYKIKKQIARKSRIRVMFTWLLRKQRKA
jgi:hypothetical protein